MRLDFFKILGLQQLALIINYTLELQFKITYQLNDSFGYYFYKSMEYLKSLRLSDLRRKIDEMHSSIFKRGFSFWDVFDMAINVTNEDEVL